MVHERCLVGGLIRIGACRGCEDLVETFWRDLQDASREERGPIVSGKIAKRRTVDEGAGHIWGGGGK